MTVNTTIKDSDPLIYMRRNDLFNNNHSRQTSSIPYLKVKDGTTYIEVGTNNSVGKKETSTCQTQHTYGGSFKMYSTGIGKSISCDRKIFTPNEFIDDNHQTYNREIRTGHQYRRIFSKYRPKTTGNTGRITTANESLMVQLLQ